MFYLPRGLEVVRSLRDRFGRRRNAVAGGTGGSSFNGFDRFGKFSGSVANKLIELGAKGDISKGDIRRRARCYLFDRRRTPIFHEPANDDCVN